MTRATTFLPLFVIAAVAVLFASQAQAQTTTTKPECEPLHELYKEWVAPCTSNGTSIPNSDSDPAWTPCICKQGFFPLAVASEQCALDGTGQAGQVTAAALDALCLGQTGYVAADSQVSDSDLASALTSATSISQSLPSATSTADASAVSGTTASKTSGSTGMLSAGSDNMVMAMMASMAAVVLATAF